MDENPYEPGMYSSQLDRINEGRSFPKATYLERKKKSVFTVSSGPGLCQVTSARLLSNVRDLLLDQQDGVCRRECKVLRGGMNARGQTFNKKRLRTGSALQAQTLRQVEDSRQSKPFQTMSPLVLCARCSKVQKGFLLWL